LAKKLQKTQKKLDPRERAQIYQQGKLPQPTDVKSGPIQFQSRADFQRGNTPIKTSKRN
jgi:hypothetical protein